MDSNSNKDGLPDHGLHLRNRGLVAIILPLFIALASCGGGGGTDSGSPPGGTTPPPTVPPPSSPPPDPLTPITTAQLGIDGEKFFPISALTLMQDSLHIASLSARAFDIRASGSAAGTQSLTCSQAGDISTTLTDADSSGGPSANDHIAATLVHCTENDVEINGTIDITVVAVDSLAPERSVRLSAKVSGLTLTFRDITATATGVVECQCMRSAKADRFVVSGASLAISDRAGTKTLRNFSNDYSAEYEQYTQQFVISGRVEAQELRRYFDFDTNAPLYGRMGRPVEAGAVSFHGGNLTVRLEEGAGRETLILLAGMRADFDGDGFFESEVPHLWNEIVSFALFQPFRPVSIPANLPHPNEVFASTLSLITSASIPIAIADMAVDTPRHRLYLSVPDRNEIVVLSTPSYHVIDRIPVGSRPKGISLSQDGKTLYAALSRGGAVAALDIADRRVTRLETAAANGSGYIDNVVESARRVYATAWPQQRTGNPTDAYLAKVDLTNAGSIERAAGSQAISVGVPLAAGPAGDFLYVALPVSSGNRLLKLALSQSGTPVVLAKDFPIDTSLAHLTLSPDGSKIVLDSGEILRTSDFEEIGSIISGMGTLFTADGKWIIDVLGGNFLITNQFLLYDAETLIIHRPFTTHCAVNQGSRVAYVAAHDQFVVSQFGSYGDLCVFQLSDRLNAPGTDGDSSRLPAEPPPITLPVTVYSGLLNEEIGTAAVDRARGYVYVTGFGSTGLELGVGRLSDGMLLHRQVVPGNIQLGRIVLNDDGSRVHILQSGNGTSQVEVFDPAALSLLAPVPFDPALLTGPGSPIVGSAFDMAWIGNDQVLLSAVGASSETSYAARLNLISGAAQRVAGGMAKFPPHGELLRIPDGSGVIMASGTKRLTRVTLQQADPDVVADRTHDELTGAARLAVSTDGKTLYEGGGVAVDATTFQIKGQLAEGIPLSATDGSAVFVLGLFDDSVRVVDPSTFQVTAVYSIAGCGPSRVTDAMIGTTPRSIVFVKAGNVCLVSVP